MSDLRDALERLAGEWTRQSEVDGLTAELAKNAEQEIHFSTLSMLNSAHAGALRSLLASHPVSSPSPEAKRVVRYCACGDEAPCGGCTDEDADPCDVCRAALAERLARAASERETRGTGADPWPLDKVQEMLAEARAPSPVQGEAPVITSHRWRTVMPLGRIECVDCGVSLNDGAGQSCSAPAVQGAETGKEPTT